ncbi:MAG: type II toxin-antitoxin system VapC family toxin [Candidatus Omnitrophica bacterium]|nr:type II toxin-antitoxin system VapC family toxin [Candidatus Omnitrophota bacterium]
MNYFLDTDICIFALKNKYPSIKDWLAGHAPEKIKVPAIVKAELLLGASHNSSPKKILLVIEQFLDPFEVVPFSDVCTEVCAQIRFSLEQKGNIIGPNDLLIASTVLAHHGTLVTHNIKEFSRIESLKLQDWTLESHSK